MIADIQTAIALHNIELNQQIQNFALDIYRGKLTGLRNLRNLRRQKYGSQKKICDVLGCDRTTYNSWELCKHWPKGDMICMIAAVLGCTIEDLYKDPEVKP